MKNDRCNIIFMQFGEVDFKLKFMFHNVVRFLGLVRRRLA